MDRSATKLRVLDPEGKHLATTTDYTLAAACVSVLGDGATIQGPAWCRVALWREGEDGCADASFDAVCATASVRLSTEKEARFRAWQREHAKA
jgi:hypothetical protein